MVGEASWWVDMGTAMQSSLEPIIIQKNPVKLAPSVVAIAIGIPSVVIASCWSIMQSKCEAAIDKVLKFIPSRGNA
ncbi:UNVERIFIED_CONTAM: hypothetical protein Slati_3396400 [Sesamum latifolium]|uniref:Uncharacterized protein n=1 Tax=Sesamum latifolium TaxID=2727402 RepID=A0AAW2UEA2_9LAMI